MSSLVMKMKDNVSFPTSIGREGLSSPDEAANYGLPHSSLRLLLVGSKGTNNKKGKTEMPQLLSGKFVYGLPPSVCRTYRL